VILSLFAAGAVVQIILKATCILALLRHWQSVPELWGIDWMDVVWRLERELRVKLTGSDFEQFTAEERSGLTAGQLWEVVVDKLRQVGIEIPENGWERLVGALCEALNVDAKQVNPDSRLYADLGMLYGVD
jgi:acyl carrier protein